MPTNNTRFRFTFLMLNSVMDHSKRKLRLNVILCTVGLVVLYSLLRSRYENATLICVGCSVHYWVTCAINKGGFFEIAFSFVVDTHLPRFEALTHVVILVSSSFPFQRFAKV